MDLWCGLEPVCRDGRPGVSGLGPTVVLGEHLADLGIGREPKNGGDHGRLFRMVGQTIAVLDSRNSCFVFEIAARPDYVWSYSAIPLS
jgi:hypothetical protein